MQYFAVVLHDRPADNPHDLFRYLGYGRGTEVWNGTGWSTKGYYMRYLREEPGAVEISKEQADAIIAARTVNANL